MASSTDAVSPSAPLEGAKGPLAAASRSLATPESELKRWKRIFDTNSKEFSGQKFLDRESFISAIASQGDLSRIDRESFGVLFRVADTTRRGLVSWDDFSVFETLLKRPDAEYWIAFQYFDEDGNGTITFDEFKKVYSENVGPDSIPFNFDGDWVKLYLGKRDGRHVLNYNQFTQLMKGLQGERLRQAFKYFDTNEDGFITPEQFKRIITDLAGHKLSEPVIERLPTLCTLSPGQKISFSEVQAFINVIRDMDMVERVIREATSKSKDGRIDQTDFLNYSAASTRYGLFSPMEAAIIFHFASRGDPAQHRLSLLDFANLLDPKWRSPADVEATHVKPKKGFLDSFFQSAYNFALGGFAGGFGAGVVYPIDLGRWSRHTFGKPETTFADNLGSHLFKSRMQNQRSTVVGQLLYKNSMDCVQKVFRNEGLRGFYRGLGPQLIGVAPEKAIKLTVNDLVRGRATDPETGRITLPWELLAGGAAGGCQVVFTNPLEIVKIRLQVQGEAAKLEGAAPRGAVHIIRQLGLLGLYKGASACLLRDVPFSAIYFPSYAHLKKDVFGEGYNGKKLTFGEMLMSAAIAGMPAAYLATPADVIKTRLQVEARKGQSTYKGLFDCAQKIWTEEGFRAFFKGGPARVIRSSPQFGFTLVAYEYLQTYLPYPFGEEPKKLETLLTSGGAEDMSRVRARNALKILLDVHGDFGKKITPGGASSAGVSPAGAVIKPGESQ